jgi:CheY-like chemotaxis protein
MPYSLRIVVADESDLVRDQIKALARPFKIDVVEAATGRQAFAALLVSDAQCGFVHVHLPEVSGFEVARRIRAANLHVPPMLVALAGLLVPEDELLVGRFDLRLSRTIDPLQITGVLSTLREPSSA